MTLHNSTDKAIRIMALLANSRYPLPSMEIAARQGLSQRHLFRIASLLRNAGLLRVSLGADGGYSLSKPPSEISMHDIMCAIEGSIQMPEYDGRDGTGAIYKAISNFLSGYMKAMSVDVLADNNAENWMAATVEYLAIEKAKLFP